MNNTESKLSYRKKKTRTGIIYIIIGALIPAFPFYMFISYYQSRRMGLNSRRLRQSRACRSCLGSDVTANRGQPVTGPLRFDVGELVREVELMRGLAESFLEPGAIEVLSNLREQIVPLRYGQHETRIGVDPKWPIRTITCDGGYERNGGGAHKYLFGELVFNWELRP